jgi:hypothetical protein
MATTHEQDGLDLAIRFSYITNALQYCGPKTAHNTFIRYLTKRDNGEDVRGALLKFESLQPYLSAIATKHSKDLFAYEVVEAYWIGNSLLDSFTKKDMQSIIRNLQARGLPASIVQRLVADLPEGFFPHHDFNVCFVGVGMTTGSVSTTIANMDNCRTSWGRVVEVKDGLLILDSQSLMQEKGKFMLNQGTKTARYLPDLFGPVKKGDVIATHWGMAGVVLTKGQCEHLRTYSKKILDVLNHARNR